MKIFIPATFVASETVINPKAAKVLQIIHSMIHRTDDLATRLTESQTVLHQDYLTHDLKHFQRLKTMTQFKKLQHACHSALAAINFDTETADSAKELEADLPKLEHEVQEINSVPDEDLKLETICDHMVLVHSLNIKCAGLPQGLESKHRQIIQWGQRVAEEGFSNLSTALSLSLCCSKVTVSCEPKWKSLFNYSVSSLFAL